MNVCIFSLYLCLVLHIQNIYVSPPFFMAMYGFVSVDLIKLPQAMY